MTQSKSGMGGVQHEIFSRTMNAIREKWENEVAIDFEKIDGPLTDAYCAGIDRGKAFAIQECIEGLLATAGQILRPIPEEPPSDGGKQVSSSDGYAKLISILETLDKTGRRSWL